VNFVFTIFANLPPPSKCRLVRPAPSAPPSLRLWCSSNHSHEFVSGAELYGTMEIRLPATFLAVVTLAACRRHVAGARCRVNRRQQQTGWFDSSQMSGSCSIRMLDRCPSPYFLFTSRSLYSSLFTILVETIQQYNRKKYKELECGPMPNVMVALPNIVGALFNAAKFS